MKIPFLLVLLGLAGLVHASSGDTFRIRSHDKVLIQTDPSRGHTEYAAWAKFPAKGKKYRKMYAELKFQCPSNLSCGEWDYTNSISILRRHGAFTDTLNWEIMRMITPYGLQFDKKWYHTWRFDITDFAPLFADSIEIEYHHSGYEARNDRGWLITLDFTMIEGEETRPIEGVKMMYHKNIGYGNDSLVDANLPELKYRVGPNTHIVRYKVIQTGHGSDATGCGEFCAKQRYMVHDGKTLDSQLVWRDDCGKNPVYPQGGTWVYDRANWCPGADVREYNLDVPVQPGSEHTIDLDMEKYKGGGNYDITLYKIELGDPHFKTDAAIYDIIAPSDDIRYSRLNPVCSNPTLLVKNVGGENISKMRFYYGWKGHKMQEYNWTGQIKPDQIAEIELPFLQSVDSAGSIFRAEIVAVNNKPDLYTLDNAIESISTLRPLKVPNKIIIAFKTNNAPSENYYTVKKADGTVILNRKNFTAKNTMYRDTLNLETGCYIFNFMDDGDPPTDPNLYQLNRDGLYWWANTKDGTGSLMIRNGNTNTIIKNFNNDFGTGIWMNLYCDSLAKPANPETKLTINPNPAHDQLMLDLGTNRQGELHIVMRDLIGRTVLEQNRNGNLDALQFLNVSQLPRGIYELTLKINNESITQKIMLN